MAPTKSTPAKAAQEPQKSPQEPTVAEGGTPNDAPPPPAPSADPAGEAAQRRAEEARFQQTPDAEREDRGEEKPQKVSKKAVKTGDALWYRGDYGPVFALVSRGGEGEADVLLLRPDEVVRGRNVQVYDDEPAAAQAYVEGTGHVAWHL